MGKTSQRIIWFTEWLSFERLFLFGQVVYGAFVLACHSFTMRQPWAALVALTSRLHVSAEGLFATILFAGAAMQWYGLRRECTAWRLRGACAGFAAFFVAFVSLLSSVPNSPGVPVNGLVAAGYFLLVLRQAAHTEWVSIRL